MKKILSVLIAVLTCVLLASCSNQGNSPKGIYADKETYTCFVFEEDSITSWFLGQEKKGTWKSEGDTIKAFYEDGEETFQYNKDTDTLYFLFGQMELKKISESEYAELKKAGNDIYAAADDFMSIYGNQNSSSTNNGKNYFTERPNIETPDSRDSTFKLFDVVNSSYYYSLGKDKDSIYAGYSYLTYLKEQGYSIIDYTDNIGKEGVIVYYLKKGSTVEGDVIFTVTSDLGYVMAVGWQ